MVEKCPLVLLADRREHLEREAPGHRRADGEHGVAALGETREPVADHLTHTLRNAPLDDTWIPHPLPVLSVQDADLDQVLDHLLDEEGISLGLLLDQIYEARGGLLARACLDEIGDTLAGQAAQQYAFVEALVAQRGDGLPQRVGALEFDIPVGPDQQHAVAANASGEVEQQQQRRLVGPVEVVEDRDQRGRPRRTTQERRHALEQAQAFGLALQSGGLGEIRKALTDLRRERRELGRPVA